MMKNNNKIVTGIISLCLVFAIFGIGYLSISALTSSSFNGPANNLTSGVTNSGTSMYSILLPLLIIGTACLISGLMFYSVRSSETFSRFGKAVKFLITTAYYFGYGVIFIIILIVPCFLIYAFYTFAVVEGNVTLTYETLKWLLISTGAFFGIGGIGYVFKKHFVNKLKERFSELKAEDEEEKTKEITI